MDDDAKRELQSLLAAHKARLVEGQNREAQKKAEQRAFVDGFRSLKAEKIRPVLEEFVAQLTEHGHTASIVDQEESASGRFTPASIGLRVVPARMGDAPPGHSNIVRVEITFSANQATMKVSVSSSNNANGSIGKRGEHDLSELTDAFVVSNVLRTIREAFAVAD